MDAETAPLYLTQNEMDYWIEKLRSFLHEPEIFSIHKKLELSRRKNFEDTYTPESLMQEVYQVSGYTKMEIRGKRGRQELSDTRAAISVILHELFPELPLSRIGWYTGRRHCAVLHHYLIVAEVQEAKAIYEELRTKLKIDA